jgi:hypothetical protein|tara:strand:- start:338 stop:790 length:453 start_codon:yes stop_codon:yes gene_type:complete
MNSESMPPELDVFISLLGEIDMLKGQISVLDKDTHIALSHSDTSAILGNAECFRILKMIETLNANIAGLNASLLNAAELVTQQCEIDGDEPSPQKKSSTLMEDIAATREEIEKGSQENLRDEVQGNRNKKENQVINNMLSYFKERFEGNE